MKTRIGILLLCLFVGMRATLACVPCQEMWDLERSLKEADLVIVGERLDFRLGERTALKRNMGPPMIIVKVEQVLKGETSDDTLNIASWYGMCAYGIYVQTGRWVMLLKHEAEQSGGDGERPTFRHSQYAALNNGCSQKTLAVSDDDTVEVDGETLTLADFTARYMAKETEKEESAE